MAATSTSTSTRRAAPTTRATRSRGVPPPADDVALEATDNIYLTETDAYLRLAARARVHRRHPDHRPRVDADHRRGPLPDRGRAAPVRRGQHHGCPGDDPDAPRDIPNGRSSPRPATCRSASATTSHTHQNSQILADGEHRHLRRLRRNLDAPSDDPRLRHDHDPARPDHRRLRRRRGDADQRPPGRHVRASTARPRTRTLTQHLGRRRRRHVPVRRPDRASRRARRTTTASRLSATATATSSSARRRSSAAATTGHRRRRRHDPSIADGEDQFTVYYLQSTNVLAAPAQLARRRPGTPATRSRSTARPTPTTTPIYTTGSHGVDAQLRRSTCSTPGAENDGVDELAIYGVDNLDAGVQRLRQPGTLTRNPTDDIFLLRAVEVHRHRGAVRRQRSRRRRPDGLRRPPTEPADHPAFVALLHGDDSTDGGLAGYRSRVVGDEASDVVQRINYDAALNGRLERLRPRRQRRLLRRRQHARSPRSTAARATTPSRSARSSARKRDDQASRRRRCCRRTCSRS